jgi:hypothetical protein
VSSSPGDEPCAALGVGKPAVLEELETIVVDAWLLIPDESV